MMLNWRFGSELCVVCSSGGHLSEALIAVSETEVSTYFVTKKDKHVSDRLQNYTVYYVDDPHTSLWVYLKNFFQSLYLFIKKRPRVILTTGAGIALASCIIGKAFGSKIIFIETGARVVTPSKTGKLLYKISDVFYVQWEAMLTHYPNAIYVGRLV